MIKIRIIIIFPNSASSINKNVQHIKHKINLKEKTELWLLPNSTLRMLNVFLILPEDCLMATYFYLENVLSHLIST